jgi:hypothetical protein
MTTKHSQITTYQRRQNKIRDGSKKSMKRCKKIAMAASPLSKSAMLLATLGIKSTLLKARQWARKLEESFEAQSSKALKNDPFSKNE